MTTTCDTAPTPLYPAAFAGPRFRKLTLPVDGPDSGGEADEIVPPRLDTYTSKYCRTASDNTSILHSVWHGGATTSGSLNPRSEWRETHRSGALRYWDGRTGEHSLYLPGLSINRLTPVKPHAVLAQMHNGSDDVTVLRAEGVKNSDDKLTNNIKLFVTDGDEKVLHIDTVPFTRRFGFGFDVRNGRIYYLLNGKPVLKDGKQFYLPATDDLYFKWGLYLQSNPKTAPSELRSSFAQARFFVSPQLRHAA